MSDAGEDKSTPMEQTVDDVDSIVKEVDDKSEAACDSCLETLEASSTLLNVASMLKNFGESKRSCTKNVKSNSDTISSPPSSPEKQENSFSIHNNLHALDNKYGCESDTNHILKILNKTPCIDDLTSESNDNFTCGTSENDPKAKSNDNSPEIVNTLCNKEIKAVENCSKTLMASTKSLNEDINASDTNIYVLNKTILSKSAENLSSTIQDITAQETATNLSHNNLNAEKILSDFANQKPKVSATQKILPDTAATNLDVRYPRLPKEILNQDLGSIYKNMHGIFNTVSGSLKHAYSISHRVAPPKLVKPVVKPVLNSKIINDIFEEDTTNVVEENGLDIPDTTQAHPPDTAVEVVETENAKKDGCHLQVEALERLLAEQRKEVAVLRERVRQHTNELQEKDEIFKDLEGKLDLVSTG